MLADADYNAWSDKFISDCATTKAHLDPLRQANSGVPYSRSMSRGEVVCLLMGEDQRSKARSSQRSALWVDSD
jgi:hypothetical protein